MINNNLTDEILVDLTEKLDLCGTYPQLVLALRELQQRRTADKNCQLYGIVDCDGSAYIDELCVAPIGSQLDCTLDELNAEYEGGEYANEGAPYRIVALHTALSLTDSEREELQQYRKAESADHEMLKRLAVILSGSAAPGEIRSLTVTAQSFVDRCKKLAAERAGLQQFQQTALKTTPGMGWIPVDHLLPKKGERVMAFIEFESEIVTPLIKEAEYTGSTFRIGPNAIGITGMPKATHWLPLLEKKQ